MNLAWNLHTHQISYTDEIQAHATSARNEVSCWSATSKPKTAWAMGSAKNTVPAPVFRNTHLPPLQATCLKKRLPSFHCVRAARDFSVLRDSQLHVHTFQDALFCKVFVGRHVVVYPTVVQLDQLSRQSGYTLETGQCLSDCQWNRRLE